MSALLKLCCGSYLLLLSLFLVTDAAITSPPDQEACVGDNVTIPWVYNDTDIDIVSVIWSVNISTDIMTYFGSTRDPENGYNVVNSSDKGSITITSATRSNSGTYKIAVSALQSTSDQVEVLICDAADTSQLKGIKSGSEWKCEALNVGDSEAERYIKVNGKRRTSSSAMVWWFDKVECCLNGCAVKCMNNGPSDYCKVVQRPWWWIIIIIILGAAGMLYVVGIMIGVILTTTSCCNDSDCECCQGCGQNKYVTCACCASLPCGVCCNIAGLPFWVQVLWGTIIGAPVALGIYMVWKCCGRGNGNVEAKRENSKPETRSGNPRTDQKKPDTKIKSIVSAQTENEQHNQGKKPREQPPKPLGAAQTTGPPMSGRPMPDIPRKSDRQGHDSKGRGLSANFSDDDHPLVSIDIPLQKKGALDALPEGTGGEEPVKKKKKKKKKQEEDEE